MMVELLKLFFDVAFDFEVKVQVKIFVLVFHPEKAVVERFLIFIICFHHPCRYML